MKLKTTFFQKAFLILLGIFLSLFLIETGLRLGGFTLLAVQEHRNRVSIKKGGAYRILCLGESTTAGQWPPFLEAALNRSGTGIQFTVIDEGKNGTNTGAVLNRLESYLDKYHPDMVVAMMGVNDPGAVHLPADTPSASKPALFIKSFKTYKLARLLFHMAFKTNRWALPPEGTQTQLTTLPALPATGPDTGDAESVQKLKKELKLNPGNGKAHLQLGWLYRDQGKLQQAEEEFKKALKLNPENYEASSKLGWLYLEQEKFQQAEMCIKKALQINPGNDSAYLQLWAIYREQGKFQQAEEEFKKELEFNPENSERHFQLGSIYRHQEKFRQAEERFKKALELNPDNSETHLQLGSIYRHQGKFKQAEERFKKALELNPGDEEAFLQLEMTYQIQGKSQQAEETFKKALKFNTGTSETYFQLANLYREQGKFQQAEERFKKAMNLNTETPKGHYGSYSRFTANNYLAIKTILDERKIRLVCVQYPMNNAALVKNIFTGKADDIVFVDNEKIFKEAVRKFGYAAYFRDMFGGNFGHCTDNGNKLLGENIAGVILKEIFHIKLLRNKAGTGGVR